VPSPVSVAASFRAPFSMTQPKQWAVRPQLRPESSKQASRPRLPSFSVLCVIYAVVHVAVGALLSAGPGDEQSTSARRGNVADKAPALLDGTAGTETVRWYPAPAREYSKRELLADRFVNFGGLTLATVGVIWLGCVSAAGGDSKVKQLGLLVHGLCLITMLSCSATFHYFAWNERDQRFFLMLDHFGINSMIAGCYTPVLLQCRCFRMLVFIAVCASIGFVGEISMYLSWKALVDIDGAGIDTAGSSMFFFHSARYLMMGWTILWGWKHVVRCISPRARAMMVAGGLSFTAGVPFHLCKSLEFHHAIWHSFVLIGSSFFYTICLAEISCGRPIGQPCDSHRGLPMLKLKARRGLAVSVSMPSMPLMASAM